MASKLTILKGRVRLCRSKIGTIFLFLLGIACVLCVLNWFSSSYMKQEERMSEFEGGGRHLSGLPGGEKLIGHGHKHHKKRPHMDDADDDPQPVCEVPKLSLKADTNKEAYYNMDPLQCTAQHLFYIKESILRLNRTVLAGNTLSHCDYRAIDRVTDNYHTYSNPLRRKENFEIRVKNDFFRVECYTAGSEKRQNHGMMGGQFDDYQRRRLLQVQENQQNVQRNVQRDSDVSQKGSVANNQNGVPVFKSLRVAAETPNHHPSLYGMGLPDLPNSMLNQGKHAAVSERKDEANIKKSINRVNDVLSDGKYQNTAVGGQPQGVQIGGQLQNNNPGFNQQQQQNIQNVNNNVPIQQNNVPLQQLNAPIVLNNSPNVQNNSPIQQINAPNLQNVQQNVDQLQQNIPQQNIIQQEQKVVPQQIDVPQLQNVEEEQNKDADMKHESNENASDKPEEIEFNTNNDYDNNYINNDWDGLIPDFDQVFAQIHPKDEVFERVARLKPFQNSTQMNVLMFALDSMSHLSYQRKLPETYEYLKNTLDAVVLDAYNIVGDATTAALIPIFTGHEETELPETRVNKEGTHYVDIYPFIWNKYEQSGYVTLYAEDQPSLGTWQLRLNGFEEQPVDHYMRPFWQAALDTDVHQSSPQYCLGGKPEHQFMLDYLKDLFIKYPKVPKFAFGFIGELSHADNNPAQYVDADFKNFLEFLRVGGYLDNTLVIVMGDHGARYSKVRQTTQGKLEERLPMMSLTFPKSFKEKHPQLMKNLHKNKDRLSTPFDLHETLRSVLNMYETEKPVKYSDRGISLLKEIPVNRTCASAGVALHWCTCMQFEYLDKEDDKVQGVARYVVDHINDKNQVAGDLCAHLKIERILEAKMVFPNDKVLKYIRSKDSDNRVANFSQTMKLDIIHYQLMIETSPNEGLYDVTVQATVADGSYSIVGDISRINLYGNQPHCVLAKHPDLRKYCYCTTEPTEKPKPKRYPSKKS